MNALVTAIIIIAAFSMPRHATCSTITKYFSVTGKDDENCLGGSRSTPWKSLEQQSKYGCILPGYTLVLTEGSYANKSTFFFTGNGRINISGTPKNPITIRSESQDIKSILNGPIVINGSHLVFSNILFLGDNSGRPIVAIGGENIQINDSEIRGPKNSWNPIFTHPGDCIKIVGDINPTKFISIEGNRISECSEDAIDINGADWVQIRKNNITRSSQVQIKGGSRNINFIENNFLEMTYGILGLGMDCSYDLGRYCGSYDLLKISPGERFQASDVTIIGNNFSGITRGVIVEASGWHRASIIENKIIHKSKISTPIIRVRRNIGSAYTDNESIEFCKSNPDRCGECRSKLDGNCLVVFSRAQSLCIMNNDIYGEDNAIQFIHVSPNSTEGDICMGGNRFHKTLRVTQTLNGNEDLYQQNCNLCQNRPDTPAPPNNINLIEEE